MKPCVLYVLAAYPRRTETFVRQDITLLLAAGVPVTVCALAPGDMPVPEDGPAVIPLGFSLGRAVAGPVPAPRRRARLASVLVPRAWRHRLARLRRRRSIGDLAALARQVGAQHIHAEFADLAALVAGPAAARCGISWSLGVHARDVFSFRFAPEPVFHKAARVLACNRAAARAAVDLVPALRYRVVVIPHGVRLDSWPFTEPGARAPDEPFRLLFAGRFVEKKGLPFLFEALVRIRRHDRPPPLFLDIAGDGPLAGAWRAAAVRRGLENCVKWHGFLEPAALRARMQRARALVVPSVAAADGDRDGIPNVILEAMAAGCPVVGSCVGGIPEVLGPETGFPVPPGRPGELAEAILGLIRAPEVGRQRARAARQRIEREFDARKLAVQRAAVFREFIEASGHG